jgi:tetratricopeptide (TPR) repeat protein
VFLVGESDTYRVLNREIFLLIALTAGAVGVFAFTRSMAVKEQQIDARRAAIWYRDGQSQLSSGQIDSAIDSFRNAATDALRDRRYELALANALADGNHEAEAQQTLLRMRESDPEDAEINSQLARLAAKRGEISDAVHFYQSALYGRWAGGQIDERKLQLRVELIRFLLGHQERDIALSELLILETDLPQSAASYVETARLFQQAGDTQHALKNYDEAIDLDRDDVDALTEAGETLFRQGNYPQAARSLKHALELNPKVEKTRQLLSITELVLSEDPLDPHLSKEEGQKRLLRDLAHARKRLQEYFRQTSGNQEGSQLRSLDGQALALESALHSRRSPDSVLFGSGMELIYTIEKATSAAEAKPDELDQALLLIGQKYSGGQ